MRIQTAHWKIGILVAVAMCSGTLGAADQPRTVMQWQIDGTVAAFRDSHLAVRARAVIQLEVLLDGDGIPARLSGAQMATLTSIAPQIVEVLKVESDQSVLFSIARASAARLLGLLNYQPAVSDLLKIVRKDGSPNRNLGALDSLALLNSSQVAEDLLKILDDADQMDVDTGALLTQGRVAATLGRLKYRPAIPAIRQLWQKKSRNRNALTAQNEAALALIRLGALNAKDVYRQWLNGWTSRNFFVANAKEVVTADVETELITLLVDKSADTFKRECAAEVIGVLRPRGKDQYLLQILSDNQEDQTVRLYAARGIWTSEGRAPAVMLATRVLSQGKESDQALAIQVLQRHQPAEAASLLEKVVGDARCSPTVRKAAIEALGVMGARTSIPVLLEVYRSPDLPFPSWYIVETLGRMGAPEAVPLILGMLESQANISVGLNAAIWVRPDAPIGAIELTFRQIKALDDAVWLVHYWGGGSEETELLLKDLVEPSTDTQTPVARDDLRKHLAALELVIREPQAPRAKQAAAAKIAQLVLSNQAAWSSEDSEELSHYAALLEENGLAEPAAAIRFLAARSESRQWKIAAVVFMVALAMAAFLWTVWAVPSVYRWLLVRRGRRWALVATSCPSEITLRVIGGEVEAQIRHRYDPDSKPHKEKIAAESIIVWSSAGSDPERRWRALQEARVAAAFVHTRDLVQRHLATSRQSRTVIVDADAELFDRPWAWFLGSLWGTESASLVAGQVTPNMVSPEERDAPLMIRPPMGKRIVVGLVVNDRPTSGLPLFRFAQAQAAAVIKQLPNIRARVLGSSNASDATVAAMKRCLEEADVVHIIAHADTWWIDLQNDRFTAACLKNLKVRCRLVVICGCKLGDPAPGGESPLITELVNRGVNVVAATATVDDNPCRWFFEQFYKSFFPVRGTAGRSIADAVRDAATACRQVAEKRTKEGIKVGPWQSSIDPFVLYGNPSLRLVLADPALI